MSHGRAGEQEKGETRAERPRHKTTRRSNLRRHRFSCGLLFTLYSLPLVEQETAACGAMPTCLRRVNVSGGTPALPHCWSRRPIATRNPHDSRAAGLRTRRAARRACPPRGAGAACRSYRQHRGQELMEEGAVRGGYGHPRRTGGARRRRANRKPAGAGWAAFFYFPTRPPRRLWPATARAVRRLTTSGWSAARLRLSLMSARKS